jgi:integrase
MASIRFYIRNKRNNPSAIMGKLSYRGKQPFIFSTGCSIDPKNWNQSKQFVTQKERAADDINTHLTNKKAEILAIHDELKRDGTLTNAHIEQRINSRKSPKKLNLYGHIEVVLQEIEAKEERQIKEGKQKKRYLHTRYTKTAKRLKEYAKTKAKKELSFDDIDLNFYNRYLEYMRNECALAENTIGGEIKRLKRFLKLGTIQRLNHNLIYTSSEFKAPAERTKHITLNEDEIETLYAMKLTGTMDEARDLFIIGCRTGLRVSDYNKCIGDTVEKTGLICIDETEKTGEPVYIPIHWQVREILRKYNGLPPVIKDIDLNEYLKTIGREAGFTQQVRDTRKGRHKPQGGGEYCPKYELITTHTARRSCATNMYLAGFDLYFIQGILGHKQIETTICYLGITRKLIAMQQVSNPYFHKKR